MKPTRPQLPIRVWFGATLMTLAVVPALAASGTYLVQDRQQQARRTAVERDVALARAYVIANVRRWHDRAWQTEASARLGEWGLKAALSDARGNVIFTTGRRVPASWQGVKLVVTRRGNWRDVLDGGAIFYPPATSQNWAGPLLAGLIALLVALGATAWLLGRTVVRPLAAASSAARGIADGRLDVRLPDSAVKEVANVSTALTFMSVGLDDALRRQERLERERRLFIGAVAHDLRTPLFALRSYLSGLKDGIASTPEKTTHYVDVCQAEADALDRLVTDLFDFARLEYLEQDPRFEPVDLSRVLEDTVQNVRPGAEGKRITVLLRSPGCPCPVLGDAHQLARAFGNVLDNALRYTPPGGEVRVTWDCEDESVTFSVEDTGPGISEADLPHVFTPLYRGDTSRGRQTGGTGLGLSIARGIIRSHGGDLRAGNGPMGGAVFSGMLPRAVVDEVPQSEPERALDARPS